MIHGQVGVCFNVFYVMNLLSTTLQDYLNIISILSMMCQEQITQRNMARH